MQQSTHGDLDIILSECLRANVERNKKDLILKFFCLTDIYIVLACDTGLSLVCQLYPVPLVLMWTPKYRWLREC